MITLQGFGLIAEVIATAMLLIMLAGFAVQRSQSWVAGVAIAFVVLVAAATIVIQSST
jgi:glycerol uptake facilitator-like aquaporin